MEGSGKFDEESEKMFLIRYPYKGEFTLKSRYLSHRNRYENDYNEHRIYVIAENEGALSDNLRGGGTVVCQLRMFQDFHVYE